MRTPEEIEALLDKVEDLLGKYAEADDAYQQKQWDDTYGERLGKYSDKLKSINGDDFDLMKESRKEYNESYKDLTPDEYIDALEQNITATLDRISSALAAGDVEAAQEAVEEAKEEVTEEPKADEAPAEETTIEVTTEPPAEEVYAEEKKEEE